MIENTNIGEILEDKGLQVWSVTPDAIVYDAIKMMADKNVGALAVLDGDRLVGMLSERDYTRKVMLQGKSSKTTQVREIISGQVVTVTRDHTVEDCLRLMTKHRVRHLPVLQDGKLAGLVSIGDLVNAVISMQRTTIEQLQTYISGMPG